jgi:hypothetical protein
VTGSRRSFRPTFQMMFEWRVVSPDETYGHAHCAVAAGARGRNLTRPRVAAFRHFSPDVVKPTLYLLEPNLNI